MNRGVIAYMREGNRCAKNTFKNFGNILKFYFLEIISFFGSLFIFPIPMMTLARVRVARLAERDEDIQIFKSFEKTDSSKHFWTLFAYFFMKFILFLAGIVFILLLMGIFAGIGLLIGGLSKVGIIIAIILAAPFALVLLAFMIVFPFMFEPAKYLYDCNTNLGLSGMFYNSIDAMRKTGKWTIFMMYFIYGLRHLLWLSLIGGSVALLVVFYQQTAVRIISAIALLVFLVLYFFRAARLLLGQRVAKVELFNDICSTEKYVSLQPVTEENTPKNIYGVSKRTLRAAKKEQLLLGLFTNGPKLKDPEGVDQAKLPNEVDEPEIEKEEQDVLAQPVPENVVEIEDNKNPEPEQPKPVYENVRQIVVSEDPEDPTNMKVNKLNNADSKFVGTAIGYFGMKLLIALLNVISLGIAVPWTTCKMERWYASRTYINGKRLRFDGRGGALFGKYILWAFLTIITLGIYGFWLNLNMKKWVAKHTHVSDEDGESALNVKFFGFTGINILTALIKVVSLGFAAPWATCLKERWYARHTVIDGRELRFNGHGGALFGKYILWGFLTIITLGIFAFSFSIRVRKWMTKNKTFVVIERNLTDIDEVKEKAAETYDRPMADFKESARYYKPSENETRVETAETVKEESLNDDLFVAEEPVVEELTEEILAEEPVVEEVAEEPVVEPTIEEKVIDEPVIEEQLFEEVIAEEPVAEPTIEETLLDDLFVATPEETAEEPVAESTSERSIDELLNSLSKLQKNPEEEKPKAKRGRKKAADKETE